MADTKIIKTEVLPSSSQPSCIYVCTEGSEGKEKMNRQLLLLYSAKCCNDKGKQGLLDPYCKVELPLKKCWELSR